MNRGIVCEFCAHMPPIILYGTEVMSIICDLCVLFTQAINSTQVVTRAACRAMCFIKQRQTMALDRWLQQIFRQVAFVLQQPLLALYAAGIAGQRALRTDHSVAGHHDADRI